MQTDLELWELIKGNDEQAFSTLFHRYSPKIYSSAYAYIKDQEVCEQIVHDIFITLWTRREKLEIRSFNAYLTAATRYRVYKHITAIKTIPLDYKENLENVNPKAVQNTGYDNLVYQELNGKVYLGLGGLPKRCREIFIMSRTQILSNNEIARKLGISKRSVENQITRALKHLRLFLKDLPLILIFLSSTIPLG